MKRLALALLGLGLVACSNNSTGNDGNTITSFGVDPIDITTQTSTLIALHSDSGYYQAINVGCSTSSMVMDTLTSDAIRLDSNRLFVTPANSCIAHIYTGNDTLLLGTTWTYANDSVVDTVTQRCRRTTFDSLTTSLVGSVLKLDSTTLVESRVTSNYCWASAHSSTYLNYLESHNTSTFTVVDYGCDQVNIIAGDVKATVTLQVLQPLTGHYEADFKFGGKTCSYNSGTTPAASNAVCSNAWTTYTAAQGQDTTNYNWAEWANTGSNWDSFITCVAGTGWSYGVGFIKQ